MAEFRVGQKVRLTRGDQALNGVVQHIYQDGLVSIEAAIGMVTSVGAWERNGWTIIPVEPPKPELPDGFYLDRWGDVWNSRDGLIVRLGSTGNAKAAAPFTRLDTMAAHAEQIIDWLDDRFGFNTTTAVGVTAEIRREFGVQS